VTFSQFYLNHVCIHFLENLNHFFFLFFKVNHVLGIFVTLCIIEPLPLELLSCVKTWGWEI